jgi:hypothetical protein
VAAEQLMWKITRDPRAEFGNYVNVLRVFRG